MSGGSNWGWAALAGFLAAGLALPNPAVARTRPRFQAGVSAVKITPSLDRTVYIAGYDNDRKADAIHDDLWARALVLDDGTTRMAVVACDLIGITNHRVRLMRARIHAAAPSLPEDHILIAATHVHSGPDTLGLWGASPFSTGLDPVYLAALEDHAAQAVVEAIADLQPVTLHAGTTIVPEGLMWNSREQIQDKELTALWFDAAKGRTVATLVNYGGHPEINKSRSITSDYVYYVRQEVEQRFGGICVFLNGALGGMVTPKISGQTFAEMERVGRGVGRAAVLALEQAKPIRDTRLSLRHTDVSIPLENEKFRFAAAAKILDSEVGKQGVETEVWRIDLGPITFVSIPGEILPKPALELKAIMPGTYHIIVALGNDELGYILEPEDYDRPLYHYERGMSVGKQTWPVLFEAAKELLK